MKQVVLMKARVVTDGNPEDEREKISRHPVNSDRIINARTLQEAIEYFISEARYIDEVTRFDYFEIDGKKYNEEYWRRNEA